VFSLINYWTKISGIFSTSLSTFIQLFLAHYQLISQTSQKSINNIYSSWYSANFRQTNSANKQITAKTVTPTKVQEAKITHNSELMEGSSSVHAGCGALDLADFRLCSVVFFL